MAWTTPKTDWTTGELVTTEDMNAVGENLALLRYSSTAVAAYTTTEDTVVNTGEVFVDVDSENMNLTITTGGGNVLVHFGGALIRVRTYKDRDNRDTDNAFDVTVDGLRQGDEENGIMTIRAIGTRHETSFTRLIQNLNPGSHTFKLQCKNGGNGITLYASAHFWVREI